MATFTMVVKSTPGKQWLPFELSNVEINNCERTRVIRVPVPPGESRYIQYFVSGIGSTGQQNYTDTITTTTDVQLILTGCIDPNPALNIYFSSAYLWVSLTASDPVYYQTGITRQHTENFF